ncbi:hypothetical protein OIU78_010020 [Salix suchowensis]|nr:hypothetical protein OIU78_010020 [Salix suchowensis]
MMNKRGQPGERARRIQPLLDQTYGSPPSSTFRLSYGYTFGAFSKRIKKEKKRNILLSA